MNEVTFKPQGKRFIMKMPVYNAVYRIKLWERQMVEVKKKKVKEVSEPRELLGKSVSAVHQEEITTYQIEIKERRKDHVRLQFIIDGWTPELPIGVGQLCCHLI